MQVGFGETRQFKISLVVRKVKWVVHNQGAGT